MRQPRHSPRCLSNRARSTGGRTSSRYSVISSTSSLHVSSPAASRDRPLGPNRSSTLIEILLHGSSNLASSPMQEDSLVGLGDLGDVTDLPGAPALHIPQGDHLSLARGEGVDGLGQVIETLPREEPRFGGAFPAGGGLGPSARPIVVRPSESFRIDRRFGWVFGGIEQGGERYGSSFPLAPGHRAVHEYAEDPRLQGRTTFEPVQPLEHGQPGFLRQDRKSTRLNSSHVA